MSLAELLRFLGQDDQRSAKRQIVALDEADRAEHDDKQHVVGTEWDAVEFPTEHMAGGQRCRCHDVLRTDRSPVGSAKARNRRGRRGLVQSKIGYVVSLSFSGFRCSRTAKCRRADICSLLLLEADFLRSPDCFRPISISRHQGWSRSAKL